jgi:hypothetical protein
MKAHLFAAFIIITSSLGHLVADEATPLSQCYLVACEQQNTENQPVHLRNSFREKEPSFTEMTILNLDIPSTLQTQEIAERILFGDADVVHLKNTSTQRASHLYEMLQRTYSHFIHVPSRERGLFIASKYPLFKAAVTLSGEGNVAEGMLEFAIHGANTYYVVVSPNDFSMQIVNSNNVKDSITTPILLIDVPGTLTLVKQQFSPLQFTQKVDLLAAETFQIVPITKKGSGNDDKGGCSGEIEVGRSWGGKDGGQWEATARLEAHDDRGNYVEAEVKQNDKGEGSANLRAGHEER